MSVTAICHCRVKNSAGIKVRQAEGQRPASGLPPGGHLWMLMRHYCSDGHSSHFIKDIVLSRMGSSTENDGIRRRHTFSSFSKKRAMKSQTLLGTCENLLEKWDRTVQPGRTPPIGAMQFITSRTAPCAAFRLRNLHSMRQQNFS